MVSTVSQERLEYTSAYDEKLSKNLVLAIIVASESNGVIGDDSGQIPWNCPADMKWFRKMTSGHPIIMGRKTFESIGKALPNRQNIVLTKQAYGVEGKVDIVGSLGSALRVCPNNSKVFIIGGAEIYAKYLGITDIVYHTEINETIHDPSGLPKFPPLNKFDWAEVYRFSPKQAEDAKPTCEHVIYTKRSN